MFLAAAGVFVWLGYESQKDLLNYRVDNCTVRGYDVTNQPCTDCSTDWGSCTDGVCASGGCTTYSYTGSLYYTYYIEHGNITYGFDFDRECGNDQTKLYDKLYDDYPLGTNITCYYLISDPKTYKLELGDTYIMFYSCAGIFAVISCGFVIASILSYKYNYVLCGKRSVEYQPLVSTSEIN